MATSKAFAPTALYDSTSDDEESFVVLGSSMPPSLCINNSFDVKEVKTDKIINEAIVEEAIDIVQSKLFDLSDSAVASFPSIPKVSEQDLAPLVEKLYLSTTTTNSSVELSPDEIQTKVDLLIEENLKLKETLHQNNMAMKDQYETLLVWQEDVMKVHQSHQTKFAETKQYIENLKIENARLIQALEAEKSKLLSKEVVTAEVAKDLMNCNMKEFELEAAQRKISLLEAEIKLVHNENLAYKHNSELQSSLTTQNENLQKEFANLKHIHALEVATYTKQLQQSDSLHKILLDEIKMLKTKSGDHSKCTTMEALDNVQEQLMAAQMHITKLQEQHNEIINTKESVIKKLQTEMTGNGDLMYALQQQVETYKSDFDEQRQALTDLTETNTKNESDLLQLQRSNNQLLEEIDRLRRDDYIHVGRLEHASASSAATPSAPEDTKWVCPKCSFRFADYKTLENHVFKCVNIDSLF